MNATNATIEKASIEQERGTEEGGQESSKGVKAEVERAARTRRPRVVIVGAGFGGINAGKELADKDVDVLILDRNNYHGFWPLLYQVATAALEETSIAYPVRAIFHNHRNVDFQMANVERIDFDKRVVHTGASTYTYDYIVLAAGSTNNYFGNNSLAGQTFGLKDIDEAEHLRNRILYNFERAVHERDATRRRELMTFVIVGGGPTGVELAGAFSELISHVLRKDYPMLDTGNARVVLVEATDKVLAAFPESLQKAAQKKLKKMGVELRLGSPVESVSSNCITFKGGEQLQAGAVVWAAGVKAAELAATVEGEHGKGDRVKIEPTLNLTAHPEVFVIGDMAYLEGYQGNQAYPMLAPVAIQQGKCAARNIVASIEGKRLRPFHYFDKGNLATIGRNDAVMDAFGVRLSGQIAWYGWLFIHLMYLVGFRNRLIVLANWAFSYFTYDRGVRLITDKEWLINPRGEPVSKRVNGQK